ncbi:uroporphyrinogen-III synthase-like [Tubulanus polymorphus]|uniref:uroporphyrinogen-III synthase-like n=1 Tax=Tubulanus polymorphus TaxID=672921 RepID=UPI003DA2F75A
MKRNNIGNQSDFLAKPQQPDTGQSAEVPLQHKTVLLFRSPEPRDGQVDPYVKALEALGLYTVCIPPLAFEYENLPKYASLLEQCDKFSAIVFTSQRAVRAIEEAYQSASDIKIVVDLWKTKPVFVVGKATGKLAESLGFNVQGGESGNADHLADHILKVLPEPGKPVLFPCGNLSKDTIVNQLTDARHMVEKLPVYRTIANPDLGHILDDYVLRQDGIPEYLVYFSPSSANYTKPYLEKYHLPDEIKHISIGPSTSKALEQNGFSVSIEASEPSPSFVAAAISSLLSQDKHVS